jgi:outer membrane protein OmpA-like peptidoglycan-associated protein
MGAVATRGGISRRALGLLVLCLAWFGPSAAWADGLPCGFGWQLQGETIHVEVDTVEDVVGLELVLRSGSGRGAATHRFRRDALRPGEVWSERIERAASGTWSMELTGRWDGAPGRLEHTFDVEIAPPLEFDVIPESYNAEGRSFVMTMNQPADWARVEVRSDTGTMLAERVIQFRGAAAGTPLHVQWTAGPGEVLTIDVEAHATSGAWASRRYIPWQVEFAPVHVNFASGSAEIPATDHPMLEERLREVVETAQRVSEWVDVQLYVAGYTDTVGSAADNQRLSEARARSLGGFFRERGWTLPVFYQGFGEDGLAVPTEDNVDEPANRRALFILSTQRPPTDANLPRASWRSL